MKLNEYEINSLVNIDKVKYICTLQGLNQFNLVLFNKTQKLKINNKSLIKEKEKTL
jgi:hypothetical protein